MLASFWYAERRRYQSNEKKKGWNEGFSGYQAGGNPRVKEYERAVHFAVATRGKEEEENSSIFVLRRRRGKAGRKKE